MRHFYSTVLKSFNGSCTNHGVTENLDCVHCFTNCSVEEALKHCEMENINPNECLIYKEESFWRNPHFEPLVKPKGKIGPMFGGNYVIDNSQFFPKYAGLNNNVPIKVHDRFETQEEYDALSR